MLVDQNLQKQKLDISIRVRGKSATIVIYKSRNWIYQLETEQRKNILYIYKSRNWIYQLEQIDAVAKSNLQKQKLDISIRVADVAMPQRSTKVEIGYINQRAGLALIGLKDAINR